jgi:hypothetical protein
MVRKIVLVFLTALWEKRVAPRGAERGKTMTKAEQIKAQYDVDAKRFGKAQASVNAESAAEASIPSFDSFDDTEQDIERETTAYLLNDGSRLVIDSDSNVRAE